MLQIDKLIRSKRKTIALIVEKNGQLTVRAPLRAPLRLITAFVTEKESWILSRREALQKSVAPPIHQFVPDELFWFLGQPYPLKISPRLNPLLKFDQGFWISKSILPEAGNHLTSWYRKQARIWFNKRVADLSGQYHLKVNKVRISSARTRWGSCSSLGTISLTWRLIMAPPQVIDYVIVHELAHLIVHNHSAAFWKEVERMQPDYRQNRNWLKKNGVSLSID